MADPLTIPVSASEQRLFSRDDSLLGKSNAKLKTSALRVIHKAQSSSQLRPTRLLDRSQIAPLSFEYLTKPQPRPYISPHREPRSASTANFGHYTLEDSDDSEGKGRHLLTFSEVIRESPPRTLRRKPSVWITDDHVSPIDESDSSPTFTMSVSQRKGSESRTTPTTINEVPVPLVDRDKHSRIYNNERANVLNPNPIQAFLIIQETCAKRMQTMGYLKKVYEGKLYWFNTVHFSKADIMKLPSFDPKKLARRATNFLLLGLSLPAILEMKTPTPFEYVRVLNSLLGEFETYVQLHNHDGSSSSSLSRATRMPNMLRRVGLGPVSKGRRASSAADIGLPMSTGDSMDTGVVNQATGVPSSVSFSASELELLPGEEYTHLLTPSLPFDPDFFETFTTLCDLLIDCYARIVATITGPEHTSTGAEELFSKMDGRVRKILVQGIVKDFEDSSKAGVKNEIAGIGKVVLGNLI
ncbi:hypothetical protein MMC25_006999 [Agyrium rufum]|nr:hypothetical protein [Agyrium rufum]